jgi:hypothetical protein
MKTFADGMVAMIAILLLVFVALAVGGLTACAGIKDRLLISGHGAAVPAVSSFWMCS